MKFGGASVKNPDAIRNVAEILGKFSAHPLLVVISAIDKTTNHLELLAHLARDGKEQEALDQFAAIKAFHLKMVSDLFGEGKGEAVANQVNQLLREVERIVQGILLLEEFPSRTYDRIVSYGEILSTTIVSGFLLEKGQQSIWVDARLLVKTDATYKQAGVIWTLTEENIRREVLPLLQPGAIVITQGFIGSTIDGKTTTLGREGSDYTASIFAHCLGADSLTVWKDVPGILNGDPRIRQNTIKIDNMSYEEAVEMTFYGATVIHPKTIKPIFNRNIPLHVKSFLNVEAPGTVISSQTNATVIPSYILKKDQTYIRIKPKDFSFMEELLIREVFDQLYKSGVKLNLVQNSAISLMLCVDNKPQNRDFQSLLLDKFDVEMRTGLRLHTIVNFTVKDLKEAADAVMVQQHDNKIFIVKE
ncbi:MAG: aspartate kinase [Bacteroidia bacterium]|nr:aspartate kinase [Bacteroidia bacterium]